jgi:peptide deformylase
MKKDILVLGNPLLRETSAEISDFDDEDFKRETADLKDTLEDFRRKKGFGRGIAAPQIGIPKRIIALNLGEGTFVLVNPEITWNKDENGIYRGWERIDRAESELIQHETDHLQGILAIDRVLDNKDIIYKAEFEKNRDWYLQQVDYTIEPTIP